MKDDKSIVISLRFRGDLNQIDSILFYTELFKYKFNKIFNELCYTITDKSKYNWNQKTKGGSNKLAKALGTAGTGKQAHHIIPTELIEKNSTVQKAIEEGFDFNGVVNGIGLDKTVHLGSHPNYTKSVEALINNAVKNPANAGKNSKEILEGISTQLKETIKNASEKLK